MEKFTLLFVHGTGVRSESYSRTLKRIKAKVSEFRLSCRVDSCEWGDVYGVDFEGLSLPHPPHRSAEELAHAYRWEYLQIDPLFDLQLWCPPEDEQPKKVIGKKDTAKALWEKSISLYTTGYKDHVALIEILQRNQIEEFFLPAWNAVVTSGLPKRAFSAAGEDGPSVSRVFAEAVVAQMMHDAASAQPPVSISPRTSGKIVTVLLFDWGQAAKGLKDLFLRLFGSVTKTVVRPLRAGTSVMVAPAIGDILNYQAVGSQIRGLIRKKIESIPGDIMILAHSLGGIACFELMIESRRNGANGLNAVKGLITAGSQAPLLYEFAALQTLPKGEPLPNTFPAWLNLYDENDLLSYRANSLFEVKPDKQVDSMLPPLQAHSAYWELDETWNAIAAMMV